jgi:hypothetical protein
VSDLASMTKGAATMAARVHVEQGDLVGTHQVLAAAPAPERAIRNPCDHA